MINGALFVISKTPNQKQALGLKTDEHSLNEQTKPILSIMNNKI